MSGAGWWWWKDEGSSGDTAMQVTAAQDTLTFKRAVWEAWTMPQSGIDPPRTVCWGVSRCSGPTFLCGRSPSKRSKCRCIKDTREPLGHCHSALLAASLGLAESVNQEQSLNVLQQDVPQAMWLMGKVSSTHVGQPELLGVAATHLELSRR